MPGAAALVDELRGIFGQAWVDAALREGLRLQREHAQRVADAGQGPADAWLASQRGTRPALSLLEGGTRVGALPGNQPAPVGAAVRSAGRAAGSAAARPAGAFVHLH